MKRKTGYAILENMENGLEREITDSRMTQFYEARRESQKLSAALIAFDYENSLTKENRDVLFEYLKYRKRPAAAALIEEGNLRGIEAMAALGWIEEKYVKDYKRQAHDKQELDIWSYLYRLKPCEGGIMKPDTEKFTGSYDNEISRRDTEKENTASDIEKELSHEVEKYLKRSLNSILPGFGEVFSTLKMQEKPEIEYLAGNGFYVFYNRRALLEAYLDNSALLERHILHQLLHYLLFHPVLEKDHDKRIWGIACDIAVECTIDSWHNDRICSYGKDYRELLLRKCGLTVDTGSAETIYVQLASPEMKERYINELQKGFHADDHIFWNRFEKTLKRSDSDREGGPEGDGAENAAGFVDKWARHRQEVKFNFGDKQSRQGLSAGSGRQNVRIIKKQEYDYRSFLQDFMVCQEEVELDLDSFDYLPYWYSRTHYDGMVIMEPLEYKETNRLDEMVIAIDTSGSCRGEVVKKFLEETWAILTEKGNFFSKMNVHIIQCDSMIQEHVVVRSVEEFEEYMENVTVKGLGGTDFRPVFHLVDELITKKELNNLKGLLYFTDGDGVYPPEAPSYTTAFIYLNKQYEKKLPPSWAIPLNLGLKMENIS